MPAQNIGALRTALRGSYAKSFSAEQRQQYEQALLAVITADLANGAGEGCPAIDVTAAAFGELAQHIADGTVASGDTADLQADRANAKALRYECLVAYVDSRLSQNPALARQYLVERRNGDVSSDDFLHFLQANRQALALPALPGQDQYDHDDHMGAGNTFEWGEPVSRNTSYALLGMQFAFQAIAGCDTAQHLANLLDADNGVARDHLSALIAPQFQNVPDAERLAVVNKFASDGPLLILVQTNAANRAVGLALNALAIDSPAVQTVLLPLVNAARNGNARRAAIDALSQANTIDLKDPLKTALHNHTGDQTVLTDAAATALHSAVVGRFFACKLSDHGVDYEKAAALVALRKFAERSKAIIGTTANKTELTAVEVRQVLSAHTGADLTQAERQALFGLTNPADINPAHLSNKMVLALGKALAMRAGEVEFQVGSSGDFRREQNTSDLKMPNACAAVLVGVAGTPSAVEAAQAEDLTLNLATETDNSRIVLELARRAHKLDEQVKLDFAADPAADVAGAHQAANNAYQSSQHALAVVNDLIRRVNLLIPVRTEAGESAKLKLTLESLEARQSALEAMSAYYHAKETYLQGVVAGGAFDAAALNAASVNELDAAKLAYKTATHRKEQQWDSALNLASSHATATGDVSFSGVAEAPHMPDTPERFGEVLKKGQEAHVFSEVSVGQEKSEGGKKTQSAKLSGPDIGNLDAEYCVEGSKVTETVRGGTPVQAARALAKLYKSQLIADGVINLQRQCMAGYENFKVEISKDNFDVSGMPGNTTALDDFLKLVDDAFSEEFGSELYGGLTNVQLMAQFKTTRPTFADRNRLMPGCTDEARNASDLMLQTTTPSVRV